MANHISDETIEYVGILAKLELNEEEKEQAKKDMESMPRAWNLCLMCSRFTMCSVRTK